MPKLIIVAPVNAHVTHHIPFLRNTNSLLNKLTTRNIIWRNENGEDYIKVRFEGCALCPAHCWRDMRWMKDVHIKYLGQITRENIYLTYLLTPWSRVLLEKLTGSAASQEIPRIFGTRRFITVLTIARHLSLS